VQAGARIDSERRYLLGRPGRIQGAAEAVRRFLHFYGPSTPGEFTDWAGLAGSHARRLWDEVADELVEVRVDGSSRWLIEADTEALASPPKAKGVRLLPAGDPYLQKPSRPLLAPEPALRKRLFRPVASPGAVLVDGRLVGLWKARANGGRSEITVEKLGRLAKARLEEEAARVARLRGTEEADLRVT
jgi:hypothetical protein